METFIYSNVNGESCRDWKEPKSIRDVNNESCRDRRQPRLIQDGEIPGPLHGTLEEVKRKWTSRFANKDCDEVTSLHEFAPHFQCMYNYEIFQIFLFMH